jgi:DMSO/TMAO reductase YedYZ molybdopterin-dependent catalytic subunit
MYCGGRERYVSSKRWSRRRFLYWSVAAAPWTARALPPDEELIPFSDYPPQFRTDAQAGNPRVKSFDLRRLTSWATPAEEFFTFHQTQAPAVEAARWRLRIGGLVEHPAEFTLADLVKRQERREVPVTIECSGNSRHPAIMNGLVSNATWTGVSLASLLGECGPRPEAREVVFLGLDSEREKKWQAGNAEYDSPHARSIYLQDALAPEPLLALAMNGQPLTVEHGFPLRLILPGWYGMAQVKWLTRIEVLDRRYEGRHMSRNYQSLRAIETPGGPLWLDTSISRTNLKSVIARVTRSAADRRSYTVSGAAWGGSARIERVELQVDGGPWQPATLDRRNGEAAWLLWSSPWQASPGRHTLVSRSVNARGEVQPTLEDLRKRLASNREDNSQWPRLLQISEG